jgi:tryptophan halogenase
VSELPVRRVVIVGGGTAGWLTAAVLVRTLAAGVQVRVVESESIGIIGVGEATIPQIRNVNAFLGIDEDAMLRATGGTFKLAIEFNDWLRIGHSYLHAFGELGLPLGPLPFQHYWLRSRSDPAAADLWAYSLNAAAARAHRMSRDARIGRTPIAGLRYAFHFDAVRYALMLREYAQQRGAQRTEGKIVDVKLRGEDGFIASVVLESGEAIEGDLFVDCSGFRALLIEDALHSGFDDWRHWLPCDRAVTSTAEHGAALRPFTQATARPAGWQWRIPQQQRSGNGHVYCSEFMSDDEATAILLANLEGRALSEPRIIRFATGVRRRLWVRNCVAIGLAAGFIEPLESTAIHLVQSGVSRLLALFPAAGCDAAIAGEYNRKMREEYEQVRDFVALHYRATERRDTRFWRHCAALPAPPGLSRKLEIFRATGQIFREGEELFTEQSWLQVMVGQGITPRRYHPAADNLPAAQCSEFLSNIRDVIRTAVGRMNSHEQFIADHCAAAARQAAPPDPYRP